MSEKIIKKGVYYSCPHQELSSSSCSTCASEAEKNREKENKLEEEYKQKDKRYFELAQKKQDLDFRGEELSETEERELNQLISLKQRKSK